MSAPRRTLQLERAQKALERARAALAAHEPGWDPWRVVEAESRYQAALAAALDGGDSPAPEPRDGVPRMLRGRG